MNNTTPEEIFKLDLDIKNCLFRNYSISLPLGNYLMDNDFALESPMLSAGAIPLRKHLSIGAFTYILSEDIHAVDIGRYCSIAPNVSIGVANHPLTWLSTSPAFYDKDVVQEWSFFDESKDKFHFKEVSYLKHTSIGNDVWIGSNAFIKGGIRIGDGSIIGACSVVTKDVPPYAIVAGNPARIIRYRFSEEIINKLLELKWWEYKYTDFNGIDFENIDVAIEQIQALKERGKIQKYEPFILKKDDLCRIKDAQMVI